MMIGPKIPNAALIKCAAEIMSAENRSFEPISTRGRSMIYRTEDNKTVRLRTSNDHVLVIAAKPLEDKWQLNIEGTDYVLVVMPVIQRVVGEVRAFLVPTELLVRLVREEYAEMLNQVPEIGMKPNAVTVQFGSPNNDGEPFDRAWDPYLLPHTTDSHAYVDIPADKSHRSRQLRQSKPKKRTKYLETVADVIMETKARISEITGSPIESVTVEVRIES